MPSIDHFLRLQMYEDRATDAVLDALGKAGSVAEGKPLTLMGHILAARRNWLTRLTSSNELVELFPTPTLDDCRVQHDALRLAWHKYLGTLRDESLGERISFRTMRGDAFSSTVVDILTHLALHSSYHRGQIAQLLRQGGAEPVATDFILFTRGDLG